MPTLFDPANCVREFHQRFTYYDQLVDIVSCWEAFLVKTEIGKNLSYFDRFPRLKEKGETQKHKRYTPDFAASFAPSYGLICEIKKTFPLGDLEFDSELEQLKGYDKPLMFKLAESEEFVLPSVHDIVLLVSLDDSHAILKRIQDRLVDPTHPFKLQRNLVLIEYYYDAVATEPRYIFRKVAEQSTDFADESLPAEYRLSTLLTQRRDSIKVRPDQFKEIKATWIFCNDNPPPIYTLTFLWTKVFYHLLSADQKNRWRTADPRKILPLTTSISEIRNFVTSQYVARGSWTEWTRSAIDTLVEAGMAQYKNRDECTIGFRNLTVGLSIPGLPRQSSEENISDIARILATYICRGRAAGNPPQDGPPEQYPLNLATN